MAQPRHRFSGPELSDLLDEVVSEHGETAAIAAVNRVRSGGVAGFFCREEFEVIVADDDEAGEEPGRSAAPAVDDDELIADLFDDDVGPLPDRADEPSAPRSVPTSADEPEPSPAAVDAVAPGPSEVPDQDDGERIPARLAYRFDDGPADEPVFGGPVAPGADRDRFLTLLERRLDETSATEADLSLRRLRSTGQTDGVIADERETMPVAPAPAPAIAPAPSPPVSAPVAVAARPATPEADRPPFWSGLDATAAELDSFVPDGAPVVAVVGPLPLATTDVRRLLDDTDLASADVFVLTDRAGIVSEPSWRLVRTANRLVHLVDRRLGNGTGAGTSEGIDGTLTPGADGGATGVPPTILLLDAPTELPAWLVALQHRLRSVGVGLFRYVVAGQPTGADLERFRQGTDVPAAIDLLSRVDPARVVELIDQRHPIVSVAGVDLGPELLQALRRHVEQAGPTGG